MDMTYTNTGFKMIAIDSLVVHRLTHEIPMDMEDQEVLKESISNLGAILVPLIVSSKPNADGKFEIYDGANRLKSARILGMKTVPCVLVETNDPRGIVSACVSIGRKRTTGQRVMLYLETWKNEVLAYRKSIQKGSGNLVPNARDLLGASNDASEYCNDLQKSKSIEKGKDLREYSAELISNRLSCADNDVEPGILLLYLIETKNFKELLGPIPPSDDIYEKLLECRNQIVAGSLAIRKWKSCVMGHVTTIDKPRRSIDYIDLASRSTTSLANVFEHWDEVNADERTTAELEQNVAKIISSMPMAFYDVTAQSIRDNWSVAQKDRLVKRLARDIKK